MAADSRDRSNFMDEIRWTAKEPCMKYIEAWSIEGAEKDTAKYREGDLRGDQEVNDWLDHKTEFDHNHIGKAEGVVNGGIRILICERLDYIPLGFRMSQSSFLAIERAFGLPDDALAVLSSNAGEHSARFIHTASGYPDSVVMMFKAPQMYQIANFGMVLSHSFKTRMTSAFLHGWNVLTDIDNVTGQRVKPHITDIRKLLQSSVELRNHPLLLPVILLKEHLSRASYFKGFTLLQITTKVERSLGVTKSGRLTNVNRPSLDAADGNSGFHYKMLENEKERIQITTTINTTLTDVISFSGVLKWDRRFCQFLVRTCDQLGEIHHMAGSNQKLRGWLDALEAGIESNAEHAETLRAKLEIQLSVLYNFVTQADSSTNSKLAAQTVLDSAAMKTLAFVTTLFLPPTFIATLFSMSMFDWQASSAMSDSPQGKEGEGEVIVSHFWIYWAVTVPLTLVVLGGWRMWWRRQREVYKRTYPKLEDV